MQTTIQQRLSLTFLVVLCLGMALAGTLTWLVVEQQYLATQRDNLLAQAQLTARALQGLPLSGNPSQPYLQTANVQPGIHARLLGEQGGVVVSLPLTPGGSPVQVPVAENAGAVSPEELRQRSEVQSALGGVPATAIRRVAAAGQRRVLYAATPILADTGEILGIVYLATPLPPASLPTTFIWQLAGVVLLASLLAGGTGILLARRIAQPLELLSRAASAVAGGDNDQHVPVASDIRELHRLGEAFNHMTASLRQSEQVKNAFIADVTHELRTPLTVINGTIETLEDGALDDIEGRGPLLTSMQRETRRLIRLVNDLLVLTRADAGALNLSLTSVNLASLAQARAEILMTLAAPRQVKISIDSAGQAVVCGDVDRLSQVLDNLLSNAIRHAPDGSVVSVIIARDGDEVRCAVNNRGACIPADHLPYIFERFYRVDASRNRSTGGAGLGLAIVRSLVLAQGGRIGAESADAQGTTLTFWLPGSQN